MRTSANGSAATVIEPMPRGSSASAALLFTLADALPADGVVVYYFHGNKRCSTCRRLEAYSEEAITGGFASELENGDLVWLVVNTDDIDFVNNPADLDALISQIARCRRGTQIYVPLGSRATETLPGSGP